MRHKKAKSKAVESPKGQPTEAQQQTVSVVHLEFPPPEALLERARGEPNRKLLLEYSEVIHTLRNEKGFSFREIAEWLTDNGVDADYNAVYRVYTKGMHPMDEAQVAQEADEEEREDLS